MEELHVILPRVLLWLVRCMMLRRDIERCLSLCHPLRETDQRLLNLMALNHVNPENKEIKRIIIF